jgi:hypothetical protein
VKRIVVDEEEFRTRGFYTLGVLDHDGRPSRSVALVQQLIPYPPMAFL